MIGFAAAVELVNLEANALLRAQLAAKAAMQPPPIPIPAQSWGALGDLVFTCINGPYEFNDKQEMDYAEHAHAFGKPSLQLIGTKLEEITMKIRLHNFLSSTPTIDLRNLLEAMRTGTPQDLVIGQDTTGNYAGKFLIQAIEHDRIEQWPNGLIKLAEVTIKLKEYVPPAALAVSARTEPPRAVKPTGKTVAPATQVGSTASATGVTNKTAGSFSMPFPVQGA